MLESFKKFRQDNKIESNSQINQDLYALFINNLESGYFVEFGACDGIYLSNTYILEKKYGWDGILAEPVKSYFDDLKRNRSCNITNLCVSDKTGERQEFVEVDLENNKGLSGLKDHAFSDKHTVKRVENGLIYEVETISLNDLLNRYNAPSIIDYLSIDTEGSEYMILESYDFSRKFKAITVEHNHTENKEKIDSLLISHGYVKVLSEISDWDSWYIHKDWYESE